MRKVLISVMTLFLFNTEVAQAACKTEACRRALAWKTGYTAVVLRDGISQEQFLSVLSAIRESGGAVAIEADEVLLGWIPASRAAHLRSNPAVRFVLYGPAEVEQLPSGRGLDALRYYNRVHSPDFEDKIEAALASGPVEFTQCIPDAENDPGHDTISDDSASHDAEREQAPKGLGSTLHAGTSRREPRRATVNNHFWSSTLNLEMRGRVTVQVFRMDSTGSVSEYDWSTAHMLFAAEMVYDMMNYWAYEASSRGVSLSFRADFKDPFSHYTRSTVPTRTNYEPINHSPDEAYLWVNEALSRHGYGASPVTYFGRRTRNSTLQRYPRAAGHTTMPSRSTLSQITGPMGRKVLITLMVSGMVRSFRFSAEQGRSSR